MKSFRLYRKPKVNPLVTEKEQAIQDITDKLREWSWVDERKEILNAVCGHVFPQKRHVQRNPRHKEAA